MKIEEFEKVIKEDLLPKCFRIMDSKGISYSGKEDKLGNFKRCSKLSGTTIEQTWFTYFVKHFDALSSFIRGEYSDSEPIEGRIEDLINYLFLLYGILNEKKTTSVNKTVEKCGDGTTYTETGGVEWTSNILKNINGECKCKK